MTHPYVYETLTRQKTETLTEEGLRSQTLARRMKRTELQNTPPRPVESEESALQRPGLAASLRRWVRRITWSSSTGINIEF